MGNLLKHENSLPTLVAKGNRRKVAVYPDAAPNASKPEFRFESDRDGEVFAGFYIDDVVVTGN
ncbi:MAG: hypothetical protein K9N23_08920 [Akkermansiaceae bacterium]|nr:hypothetical protein [Akkermansiaceae bacterium]